MSGCAGSCCSSAPICPCRFEQNPDINSLPHVVGCFQALQAGLYAEQAYYASLPTLQDAVIDAVQALGEENGLRPKAETTIDPALLDSLQQRLIDSIDKIETCQTFIDLHTLVDAAIDDSALSATDVYDTALRIALHTSTFPKQIKIHSDNLESITALCGDQHENEWLNMSELPAPFQQLSAAEVELCLSICRQKICGLVDQKL